MKTILLIFILSLTLSACVPNIGRDKPVDSKGEFLKEEVVGGFPNLPLFPDVVTIESYGDGENFGASFISDEKLAKVVEFYPAALTGLGWEYSVSEQSASRVVFDFKNQEYDGQVIINTASDGKATAISIFAQQR